MRSRPRPVMMRRGHRFTGGRPPPEEAFLGRRAPAPLPRLAVDTPAEDAARVEAPRPPVAAREARSPARPDADAERRDEGRLGEFLRWSATPPRYRAGAQPRS